MATNVTMPKMGYDMEEGKILRWLKNEGDAVVKGEPIAEIETDKVAIEIEAFANGVLAKILTPAGESQKVGAAIGIIAAKGEKVDAPAADASPKGEDAGKAAKAAAPAGEGTAPEAPAAEPAARAEKTGERIFASPLAKRIAADTGVDLASVQGSGPNGRIVKKDVEGAQGAAPVAGKPAGAAAGAGGRKEPLSGMRKAIARRMTEAMAPIPHFYVTMAVDMDAAMALRAQINEGREKDDKISVNDLIVKACAISLRKHPTLNARWDGDGIFYPDDVAISVAVAIPDGLIAPDIHGADIKSVGTIGREIRDKAGRAKAGQLAPDEYNRGTFTVSNLGMFGVEAFTAIVTPPQSAALAVGAVTKEPVVRGDQVVVGQIMRFTVSADHRVTDGAGSAQFAAEVKKLLENPLQLLV